MEETNKTIVIKDALKTTSATAPEQGNKILSLLIPIFKSEDIKQVIIDFQGLDVYTSGFTNNAIGKLFFSLDPQLVLDKISITGIETEDDFNIIRDTMIESIRLINSLNIDKSHK